MHGSLNSPGHLQIKFSKGFAPAYKFKQAVISLHASAVWIFS